MYRTFDYVHDFGSLPYIVLPFNDCDNFAICAAMYMEVEKVVTDEFEQTPEKTLGQAARDMYAYYNYKIVPPGLFLGKGLVKNFLDLGSHTRYADMKITGCRAYFNAQQVVQFCGMTMFIDDDTLLVIYRGTDDTIVGWHEDLDMYYKKVIPSHNLSVQYLKDVAAAYPDKKIIVAGHSKGGHLALYAALSCPKEIRSRLIRVYNNEGPGFADRHLLDSPAYREIKPIYKHFVPSSSMIGVMMNHDNDYEVVKASGLIGLAQHGADMWKVKNNIPDTKPGLSFMGRLHDVVLADFLASMDDDELDTFYSTFCDLAYAPGQDALLGVAKNFTNSVRGVVSAVKNLSDEQKKMMKRLGRNTVKLLAKDIYVILNPKKENQPAAVEAI